MATCGVLTLLSSSSSSSSSQSKRDGSIAPEDAEQDTPCMFTLDESALTWQPTDGAAAGERNGRFMLLDTLAITREAPDTFTLTCDDGEQFTVQAPSEGECAMWFKAISRGICEAKGEEYEEEEEKRDDYDEDNEIFDTECNLIHLILILFTISICKSQLLTMTLEYRS